VEVPAEDAGPTPADTEADSSDQSASIQLTLPAEAQVFVNNAPTTSTGSQRQYVSRGLKRGLQYSYNFRVEYQRAGKSVVENRQVKIKAGARVALDFSHEKATELAQTVPVKTELEVEVPAGAKVYLAGAATKQQGTLRRFVTTRLAEGAEWHDYTVRVELQQDGKTLTKEKTLQLNGGQTYKLAFEFDSASTQLALLTP
jgi:uncharacterized protein (TIGR03000 family)